jgi:hypothetical protein
MENAVSQRAARVKLIKWDSHVCAPFDKVEAASSTPALNRFADEIADVVAAGGTVLTTVPLNEPGTAAIVALVSDD